MNSTRNILNEGEEKEAKHSSRGSRRISKNRKKKIGKRMSTKQEEEV